MFDGTLVPPVHLKSYKCELDHLVEIGVLVPRKESEWVSPTFIIPEKDGLECLINNICQLNKVIKCRQYHFPIILDIVHKRSGYEFVTKLEISMKHCTFELDKGSQDLCTIIMPVGKYKYARLSIGLQCPPDIAQAIMETYFPGIKDANIYIDDVGAFSKGWDRHIQLLA
eukprot:CCRYP_017263-RA/>CCRYP_017263-RA protein AED:0.41 eAED:0.41 QI:0/0/0/1/0/0/2/0/169